VSAQRSRAGHVIHSGSSSDWPTDRPGCWSGATAISQSTEWNNVPFDAVRIFNGGLEVGLALTLICRVNFDRIKCYYISFDSSWRALSKVFWAHFDVTSRSAVNRRWTMRYRTSRPLCVSFTAERYVRSFCTQNLKCRAAPGLSNRSSYVNVRLIFNRISRGQTRTLCDRFTINLKREIFKLKFWQPTSVLNQILKSAQFGRAAEGIVGHLNLARAPDADSWLSSRSICIINSTKFVAWISFGTRTNRRVPSVGLDKVNGRPADKSATLWGVTHGR
jgi:hypothetical protein